MAQQPPQQQQHYAHPSGSYSPSENIHSPGTPQQFAQPPSKRQKLSPNPPSQPSTPYAPSPYGVSPSGSTHASPHFAHIQIPPSAYGANSAPLAPSPSPSYSTPYSNGHTPTSGLPPSQLQPNFQPPGYPSPLGHPNHTQSPQQGNYNNYGMAPQHPGAMGPPSKPADKLRDEVDPMDVLGGTGVNLQEEEQFMFQINNNNSFNSQLSNSQSGTLSSGHSFTQFPPGNEASFYGAGPANAAADMTNTKSQDEYLKKVADKAWGDAAYSLAASRAKELNNPFLFGNIIHGKMDNVAAKHGLSLNKESDGNMGYMKRPETFHREIRAQTIYGSNATMTATNGNFLPNDSQLIDQAALLSISLKHRLRDLLEDAVKISRGRQAGSHGVVSNDWANAAVESSGSTANSVANTTARAGWESAESPGPVSLKLSSSANISPLPHHDDTKNNTGRMQIQNGVVTALRSAATKERDAEEIRLKKRQDRAAGGDGATRQGSAAPGTPGSIAPDPMEKAPTKKEQKKKQESKANEAATHAAANVTTAQFLGGGGGIFGKKKKYSWMTGGGGPGSGASTPGRLTTGGLPSTPGGPVQAPVPERLTAEPARRLGQWREDQLKGNRIQLRDWVAVLEGDGQAKKPLQKAYMSLDVSDPKGS